MIKLIDCNATQGGHLIRFVLFVQELKERQGVGEVEFAEVPGLVEGAEGGGALRLGGGGVWVGLSAWGFLDSGSKSGMTR